MPFSGPGSRLMINGKGAGRLPWVLDPPFNTLESFEQLAAEAPSYGIAFADLNETTVIHSGYHAIVKEVSMRRLIVFLRRHASNNSPLCISSCMEVLLLRLCTQHRALHHGFGKLFCTWQIPFYPCLSLCVGHDGWCQDDYQDL